MMKRKLVIGLGALIFFAIFVYFAAQQIQPEEIENAPEWVSLQEALERASAEDRLVMIDIYEVGCKFCRAMDREIYPSPSVRSVLDREYVPVKINGHSEAMLNFLGEEMSEKDFALRMGVTAYPFTVLMDANGNVIDSRRGYQDIVTFTRYLRGAVEEVAKI
ncbi:MAG TPA: DUF255 domain-containing protein [Balneolaceae bacterium]|nr:DUF255 domain-containing protein [Balneolaceae bacterium]